MTELQLGLIGLGGAAVVGVLAYNKWQEYRHRKLAEAVFNPQHEDVLLGETPRRAALSPLQRSEPGLRDEGRPVVDERHEPVFADPVPSVEPEDEPGFSDAGETPAESAPPDSDETHQEQEFEPVLLPEPRVSVPQQHVEPEVTPQINMPPLFNDAQITAGRAETAAAAGDQPAGDVPPELLDPRLEFIVAMELVDPVPAEQILQAQRDVLHRLHKPVLWAGFNERTREWAYLVPGSNLPVRRLRVGLQLVNRLGPVADSDVAIFTGAMSALADELMAVADMPPSRVLDQAAEIDRFCAAVDLEIGLNLVSRASAFSGTKVRALAESAGMQLGVDGMFTRHDDEGRAQFSLQNYESTQFSADSLRTLTTHGLTFLLDVPRVDHGERVFLQMSELAKRFAESLQGALVDDNRQPLSESQLEHIRREFVGKPQATMASFGLPAGSPQALRLFS